MPRLSKQSRIGAWTLVAFTLLTVSSCADNLTEIVVVIETDMPNAIDLVDITATNNGEAMQTASTTVGGVDDARFPLTLGLLAGEDKAGEVLVRVAASNNSANVITAEAQTHFIEGRRLVLRIFLSQGCVEAGFRTCTAGTTCSASSFMCVSSTVDPTTLPEWTGSLLFQDAGPSSVDAGSIDAATQDLSTLPTDSGPRSALDAGLMPTSCDATEDCTVPTGETASCTVSQCNTTTHMCIYMSLLCNDGLACTTDACMPGPGGRCTNTPIEGCAES